MSRGPRQDGRGDERYRQPDRRDSAFGASGAALLGELRRIPDASGNQFHGARHTLPASRPAPEAGVADFIPRKRATTADHRQTNPGGSVRAWLDRLDIDEHTPADRVGRAGAEATAAMSKPSSLIVSFEARVARRSKPRSRERVQDSITCIPDLPMNVAVPPPAPASAKENVQATKRADRLADRPDVPSVNTPDRREAAVRTARSGLGYLAVACGRLVSYFRVPETAIVEGGLTERLLHGFQVEFRTGLRVLVLGVGLTGGWAILVPLAAAVTLPGTLVVESSVKKIQYPAGGVIAEIRAQDGMHVKQGDLLARIDETQLRANLQVLSDQLDETRARIARLTAERDGTDAPKLPPTAAAQGSSPDAAGLLASETTLFKARLGTRETQKQLLHDNIAQLEQEIDGVNAQIKSKSAQLDLIASEQKGVQSLYDKQLVPLARLTALQREAAQLDGERSQLQSSISEIRSKISQAELQITKIDQDMRSDVMKDMRDAQDKQSELTEKIVAARDQLNRVEIRSPTAGVVHQLSVHTIGGVVAAGEVIMEIVPDSDDLEIEAKLPPTDIDHVHVGQDALVRFSAFNQRTTPQVRGLVSYVSADLTQDPQTKSTSYYTVRVTLTGEELRRLGKLQLVSGMPAELFLQTGSRTMMSYLLKPITDQLKRTFSEP